MLVPLMIRCMVVQCKVVRSVVQVNRSDVDMRHPAANERQRRDGPPIPVMMCLVIYYEAWQRVCGWYWRHWKVYVLDCVGRVQRSGLVEGRRCEPPPCQNYPFWTASASSSLNLFSRTASARQSIRIIMARRGMYHPINLERCANAHLQQSQGPSRSASSPWP